MTVREIFTDAQTSTAFHKTLAKRLRKLEVAAFRRSQFEDEVKKCIITLLNVPRAEKAGSNTVKFLEVYCQLAQQQSENEMQDGEDITHEIFRWVLPFMLHKDKDVRFRATQVTSRLVGIAEAIEDELYTTIRFNLMRRMHDKVPAIRLAAIEALGRIVQNEMDEEAQAAEEQDTEDDLDDSIVNEDAKSMGLLQKLLDMLRNDTSPEVRKKLLLNIPVHNNTISLLLERAKDKDVNMRRAIYAKVLYKTGDFRYLSLSMREKLLRWGLRDKDERLRQYTAKVFSELWIEQIARSKQQDDAEDMETEQPKKRKQLGFCEPDMGALEELLERIDILNVGHEDGIGLEAMKHFWSLRRDYFDAVFFDDDFLADLNPERAFIARSFYDYCKHNDQAQRAAEDNEKIPVVSRLGYHLQKYLNSLLDLIRENDEEKEEMFVEQEFVCEQLLNIACTLDYNEEYGRRKMEALLRQTLSTPELPEEVTRLTAYALRLCCVPGPRGERAYTDFVLEAIADVHDSIIDDAEAEAVQGEREGTAESNNDSFVSAQSTTNLHSDDQRDAQLRSQFKTPLSAEEEALREEQKANIELKCLHMSHAMLQNIVGDIRANVNLDNHLNNLIIPSIRSQYALIREKAIECLGLCCLLSESLANDNKQTFEYCLRKGHAALQSKCLKILDDLARTWHKRPANIETIDTRNMVDERRNAASTTTVDETAIDLSPWRRALNPGKNSEELRRTANESIARLMLTDLYAGCNVSVFDEVVEEAIGENKTPPNWDVMVKTKALVAQTRVMV